MSFKEEVSKVIEELRPGLQADSGDVELVDADEATGIVKVKLLGHCETCAMAEMTLRFGIEQALKEKVKGVKEVVKAN